jgi:hypothetical protein
VVRAEELSWRQLRWPIVSWKSAYEEKTRRLVWNGRQPGTQLVEGSQFSWPLQGRLRRDGAVVELTVDRRWRERGKLRNLHCEKPLLGNGCWRQQAGRSLSGCCDDLWIVELLNGAVIIRSSINQFANPYPVYSHTPNTWKYIDYVAVCNI